MKIKRSMGGCGERMPADADLCILWQTYLVTSGIQQDTESLILPLEE